MPTIDTLAAAHLAEHLEHAIEHWIEGQRGSAQPHEACWASARYECERRMTYDLVSPELKTPPDAELLMKFRRGNDREAAIIADLNAAGRNAVPSFKVIGQQEGFQLRGRDGRIVIRGKVDGKLQVEGQTDLPPIEVKSWSTRITDGVRTFADLVENKWTRPGAFQMSSYLVGHNQPLGFMVLDRSGVPLVLPVELDDATLEMTEAFLSAAERVTAHAAAGTLPPFIDNWAECTRCPYFGSPCQPDVHVPGAQVLFDDELERALEEWHALRDQGKKYQALDADLKRRLRGVEHALVGHFSISGKWQKQSRLELPPDIKLQFTVTEPKGKFLLEVTRL